MKKDNILDIDKELRRRLQSDLPVAGTDEWFTRKVMNRLPDKHPSSVSWIERLGFLLAGIALVVMWILFGRNVVSSGALTLADVIICGSFLALGVALAIGMLRPLRN